MENIIAAYKNYLYQIGYSKNRQKLLPVIAAEFLAQAKITDIRTINQEEVKCFYGWLQERPSRTRAGGISEGTIQQYVDGLRNFFKWLESTQQISYNPISGCRFRRVKLKSREALNVGEIAALFDAAATIEEKAILHLCYSCGLRRSEAVALNIRDVHFRDRLLYVRAGKGSRRRVIPFTESVATSLELYYRAHRLVRTGTKYSDEAPFMVNGWGTRMRGKEYNQRLKEMVKKSGINKPSTSLHTLRHSIATHLLEGGMQMVFVKSFLGHENLSTTQIYARANKKQLLRL